MRHRVTLLHALVVPGRHDLARFGQHRPDRHPAGLQALPGLDQGQSHHVAVDLAGLPVSHGG